MFFVQKRCKVAVVVWLHDCHGTQIYVLHRVSMFTSMHAANYFFSFGWPRHTSKVMYGSSVAMKWRMVPGRVTVLSSSLGCEGKLSDDLRL